MKRLLTATALSLLLATPGFARETYALLVGASQYDNLAERYWLKGPANDIALVRAYLASNPVMPFDEADITVLADGLPGAQRATLAAIRQFASTRPTFQSRFSSMASAQRVWSRFS